MVKGSMRGERRSFLIRKQVDEWVVFLRNVSLECFFGMGFRGGDGSDYACFGIIDEFFIIYFSWWGVAVVLLDLEGLVSKGEGMLNQEPSSRNYKLNSGF